MAKEGHQADEMLEILGLKDFLRVIECYGGCRLTVPVRYLLRGGELFFMADGPTRRSVAKLSAEIGDRAATLLVEHFSGQTLRMPLARTIRAVHYRKQGLSNRKIALRLGLTETSVDKLFKRQREQHRKPLNNNHPKAANDAAPKRRLVKAAGM